MKLRNFAFLLPVIFLLSVSSCSKEKTENKIVGTWNQISVGQIPQNTKIVWSFEDNKNLFVSTYKNEILVSVDTASWELEMRFAKKNHLKINGIGLNDGKYLVHELDDFLKIQRVEFSNGHSDAAFLWMEFEKK